MAIQHSQRLAILETAVVRKSLYGPINSVCVSVWPRDEIAPIMLAGAALFCKGKPETGWFLSHILIEDSYRRQGYATEFVKFYEEKLGKITACFASSSGTAFALSYIKKFGPRPHWKVV